MKEKANKIGCIRTKIFCKNDYTANKLEMSDLSKEISASCITEKGLVIIIYK